jgi:hypothetical protein
MVLDTEPAHIEPGITSTSRDWLDVVQLRAGLLEVPRPLALAHHTDWLLEEHLPAQPLKAPAAQSGALWRISPSGVVWTWLAIGAASHGAASALQAWHQCRFPSGQMAI